MMDSFSSELISVGLPVVATFVVGLLCALCVWGLYRVGSDVTFLGVPPDALEERHIAADHGVKGPWVTEDTARHIRSYGPGKHVRDLDSDAPTPRSTPPQRSGDDHDPGEPPHPVFDQ